MLTEPKEHTNETLFQSDLNHFTVFSTMGADAITFLQSQITQDISLVSENRAALAAYCSPKGRVLGSFLVWKVPSDNNEPCFHFLMRSDIAEPILKRLRMYVLRAKVKLEPEPLQVKGIWSNASMAQINEKLGVDLEHSPTWSVFSAGGCTFIRMPDAADNKRFLCLYPSQENTPPCFCSLLSHQEAGDWDALDILSGIPWTEKNNQELFIPQSINFDVIDGISFTKGCYPGQEVVARSHYRGTLKRRMAIGVITDTSTPEDWQPGKDVFDAQETNEPCGIIVNSALSNNKAYILFETKLAALDHDQLCVGSPEGARIELIPVPYSLEKPEIGK